MATPEPTPTPRATHLLKSGAPAHRFTPEERRQGGLTKQARDREARQQLEQQAREQAADELAGYLIGAVRVLGGQLESDDERVAQAAARDILDRILGKPNQSISGPGGGPLEVESKHVEESVQRFTATVVSLTAPGAAEQAPGGPDGD